VRAARAELVGSELACVEAASVDGVCADVVDVGTGVLPTSGIDGVAIESDDEAIWPSCVVPVGIAAVGAALALTSASCPVEPTLDSSAVFVCSVVVVWASVVSMG
jgi:hypothetical protein